MFGTMLDRTLLVPLCNALPKNFPPSLIVPRLILLRSGWVRNSRLLGLWKMLSIGRNYTRGVIW